MTNAIEKLSLISKDANEERLDGLRQLFPEAFKEGTIDWPTLQHVLGQWIDPGKERFGLNWPGKKDALKTMQQPSTGTLLPMREESQNFDSTGNLIIEGDNLEVLKLLQKSYYDKVKMIYIDPPYNTGHEFVYPDNFQEGLQDYLRYTGQVDSEGLKLSANTESDGRYHSKWLNMMSPRLFLARNLMTDDGMIFISIDDNEVHNLRALMNEVFGEENFVDSIVWKKRYGGGAKEKYLVSIHEYILVYAKNINEIADIEVPLSEASIERYYTLQDANFEQRGPYRTHPLEAMKSFEDRPNLAFSIKAPDGATIKPKRQWRWSQERMDDAISKGEVEFVKNKNGEWSAYSKQYLKDESGDTRSAKVFSIIDGIYTQQGTNEIFEIFGDARVFPFPKPSKLIAKLIEIATNQNDVVMDFFAGSGSTGHAVMAQNAEDGGNRKYILVQLPEQLDPESRDQKAAADFCDTLKRPRSITELTKERLRRVSVAIQNEHPLLSADIGFKVLRLASSNFKVWDSNPAVVNDLSKRLKLFASHIEENRSTEDILYELLVKAGFPLTAPVEKLAMAGKEVFSVSEGALMICLDLNLSIEVIEEIVGKAPQMILCLDEGFNGNDQLKVNAVQTVKSRNQNEETDIVFRVV